MVAVVGASFQPLKYDYAYSTASFDDSSWNLVDVPHDSLVNGTFVDNGDDHHGYLPRNVSWYRKHFTIPTATPASASGGGGGGDVDGSSGGEVWALEFEGTFHYTSIWINGNHVMDHSLGYTPYLDNSAPPPTHPPPFL